jgi:AcrR family transcriptional regulator
VSEALVAASERLCSEQPPGSVTVRSIADAAGVNHGLVHHYFGSKLDLLGATMLSIERVVLEELEGLVDPVAAADGFLQVVRDRPSYPRLLSWMLLEGVDPTDHIGDFPLVARLVQLVEFDEGVDTGEARVRVATLLAFVAGLATTADFMADAADLSDRERELMSDRAVRVARWIVSPVSEDQVV